MRLLLPITLILVGCSSGGSGGDSKPPANSLACNSQYVYTEHQHGESGLHLHPTVDEIGEFYSHLSFEEIEEEYLDLEKCMVDNMTPGPNVRFTSFNHYGIRLELAAYLYATQTVFIDTDEEEWLPDRNCISDREFLRHEFGHHVLSMNGLDDDHSNPLYAQCSALGPKSCNGQYCYDDD